MSPGGQPHARLLSIFRAELSEHLDAIADRLLRLGGGDCGEAEFNVCMRAAHNVKGAAHSVGIDAIGQIAHRLEAVFDELRVGRLSPSAELVDRCLGALDNIRAALSAAETDRPPAFDLDRVLLHLDGLLAPQDDSADAGAGVVEAAGKTSSAPTFSAHPPAQAAPVPAPGDETVRVAVAKLDRLTAVTDQGPLRRSGQHGARPPAPGGGR
jgi:two-component system chemotaxis sensor kinase CheA